MQTAIVASLPWVKDGGKLFTKMIERLDDGY